MEQNKQKYTAPELTVVTFAAERGYAFSLNMTDFQRNTEMIIIGGNSPIDEYNVRNNPDGSNINTPSDNFWNF